mgnify:CR=1 FL=1
MKNFAATLVVLVLIALPLSGLAENSTSIPGYVIHHNAFTTDTLSPEVARHYNLTRSKNRGMINIAILQKVLGTAGAPVAAEISASATNLTGQKREIGLREIREGTAIYYIGEFPITNEETLRFKVSVKPQGESETQEVNFKQQFFTE